MSRRLLLVMTVLASASACMAGTKPEPGYKVNPSGRSLEPPAERVWLSCNHPWAPRVPFEVQLDQRYYYADEAQAYLLLRLNTQNMVANGTFELDPYRRGWPADWKKQYWEATRRFHLRKGDPTSLCLRLGEGHYWASQQVGGVKAGKKYVIAFRAKTDQGKVAGYEIIWDGGQGTKAGRITNTEFKEFTVEVAPRTDKPVEIKFHSGAPGRARSADVGYFAHVRMFAAGSDGPPAWPFAAAAARDLRARVTLTRVWGGRRRVVDRFTVSGLAADTTLTKAIPLAKFPSTGLGKAYRLRAELTDAGGKPIRDAKGAPLTVELAFGRIDPPRQTLKPIRTLRWSDDYACFVNEEPFFPLMLYNWYDGEFAWDEDMPEMREMGFNTVYLADRALEKVKKYNLYFLLNRPSRYQENPPHYKIPDKKLLDNAMRNYKEWLLAYADGVEWEDKMIPVLREHYRKDKQIDPDRPVIQCVQGVDPGRLGRYPKAADILWVEPHTHQTEAVATLIQHARDVGKANPSRTGKSGVWVELATYSPWGPPGVGADDVRRRAYAALARGVQGMDWYAHHAYEADGLGRPGGRVKDINPLAWGELRGLLAEIIRLTPALCAPQRPGLTVTPDMVDTLCREVGGKIYVLASPSFWYFKGQLGKPYKSDPRHWWAWSWQKGPKGRMAHKAGAPNGGHAAHWYFFGKNYSLRKGDKILQEVYIEPGSRLDSLVINCASYAIRGDYYEIRGMTPWIPWNAFQFWGSAEAFAKVKASRNPPYFHCGPLPQTGKWVTLEMDPANMDMVSTGCIYYYQGTRWMINASPGTKSTVWFGRTLLRRADGKVIEVYGPTPGNKVTFTVAGLKPTSRVVSLLDGRVLPVTDGGFSDVLFSNNQHGAWPAEPKVYEITP